jgi:hypothetical protein
MAIVILSDGAATSINTHQLKIVSRLTVKSLDVWKLE